MPKPKLIICTVGTSVSKNTEAIKKYSNPDYPWDSKNPDGSDLRQQINKRIADMYAKNKGNDAFFKEASAEINSLHKIGIEKDDRIVLISTDTLQCRICAEELQKIISRHFGLDKGNIEIKRIEGLQVHDGKLFRDKGLQNLIKTVIDGYILNTQFQYSYDIILNPTGGFKGVVPFLTVLGMLFSCRTVYVYEFSNDLINLPPLPFSIDGDIYLRVREALKIFKTEVAITKEAFLSKIKHYDKDEENLFLSFTEPYPDEPGKITLSALAYCLTTIDDPDPYCYIAKPVLEKFNEIKDKNKKDIIETLINNCSDPIWRSMKAHSFTGTDLLVIKPGNTPERLAGLMKDNKFHVAVIFTDHKEYEKELPKYSKKAALGYAFEEWHVNQHEREIAD